MKVVGAHNTAWDRLATHLAVLLTGLTLLAIASSCGTEVGNGDDDEDTVEAQSDTDKKGAEPGAKDDMSPEASSGADDGEDGGAGGSDGDQEDDLAGNDGASDSAPVFGDAASFQTALDIKDLDLRVLILTCGSPFRDLELPVALSDMSKMRTLRVSAASGAEGEDGWLVIKRDETGIVDYGKSRTFKFGEDGDVTELKDGSSLPYQCEGKVETVTDGPAGSYFKLKVTALDDPLLSHEIFWRSGKDGDGRQTVTNLTILRADGKGLEMALSD